MITVVIGTFGSEEWKSRGENIRQYIEGFHDSVIHVHADSLAEARNSGAQLAEGDWICFLDADDLLDHNYLVKMEESIASVDGPVLIQPATVYWSNGEPESEPFLIPSKPSILESNWMVIGTLVQKEQFLRVGGFRELEIYEDWDLWIRCVLDGATLLTQPSAIYHVFRSDGSRNNQDHQVQMRAYNRIRADYGV